MMSTATTTASSKPVNNRDGSQPRRRGASGGDNNEVNGDMDGNPAIGGVSRGNDLTRGTYQDYLGRRDRGGRSGSGQSNMRNGRDVGDASREGGGGQREASLDDQWEGMVEQKEMAVQDAHEITVDLFIALLEEDPRTSIDQVRCTRRGGGDE